MFHAHCPEGDRKHIQELRDTAQVFTWHRTKFVFNEERVE
jgi:hypothetical protein